MMGMPLGKACILLGGLAHFRAINVMPNSASASTLGYFIIRQLEEPELNSVYAHDMIFGGRSLCYSIFFDVIRLPKYFHSRSFEQSIRCCNFA